MARRSWAAAIRVKKITRLSLRNSRLAAAAVRSTGSSVCIIFTRITMRAPTGSRSEEHTSELQSLMRISYAVFCLKKKKNTHNYTQPQNHVPHPSHNTTHQKQKRNEK